MKDKRYYWIKLRTDFFNRQEIDFILSQKNGCQYIVLYQMLCLNTANNDGIMASKIGDIFIPYDINKIVRDTKYFDFDTVSIALSIFKKLGLIYEYKDDVFAISDFDEMVGSEAPSAKRVREYRERQKMLKCNNNVTQEIDNKDLDKKIDKDIYNICHLRLTEKEELCCKCYKKHKCSLPTSSSFKMKYRCNVEDYNPEKSNMPIYYKDADGKEYWNGKLMEIDPATPEEQAEMDELLKEFK